MISMSESDRLLHDNILAAHEVSDSKILAKLYLEAANRKRTLGDAAAVPFLLTQAYVFALESGDPLAEELHRELVMLGSEI